MALLGRTLYDKFISSEGRSYDALVTQLGERIGAQEGRLTSLENGLDAEREARRQAETKVYELTMRIMRLEFELKKHNIEVPE
ncbi:hypothetical protein ACYX7E_09975 [Luteimonas sp. RIT-PG2_3]